MERINQNNAVHINGIVETDFIFDHVFYGEKYYMVYVSIVRKSGEFDHIPVIVSDRIIDASKDLSGEMVNIDGEFRSYNKEIPGSRKLILFVFAKKIEVVKYCSNENEVFIRGFVCRKPIYRETPKGRKITDLMIAVNRFYSRSDYIPCICWERNARYAEKFEIGNEIAFYGRIQSREYQKKISDTEIEYKTAYEVSISRIEKLEGGK